MKKPSILPRLPKLWVSVILLLTVFLALTWTGHNNLEDRVITARYFLFALTGLIAFLTPYALFPDKNIPVVQLGNLPGLSIRKYLLEKIFKLVWPVYILIALMFFGDLESPLELFFEKLIYTIGCFSLFSGVLFISIIRYLKSGESSQFWKESVKGRRLNNLAYYFKYQQIDPASFPSLVNTMLVFSVGSVSLVIGAVLQQQFSLLAEAGFFLIILMIGIFLLLINTKFFVQNFYVSNAFFHEFFGASLKGEEVTSKREAEQLWWVPARLKMHVWQFLLQLDKKIPAGRAVSAGHLVVWFIAYQKPDPEFLTIIWILFAMLHHLFTVMTIQEEMAPYWLLRWIDEEYIWTLSRFWMQLRWIVPLLLSMNTQYFIFGTPGFYEQGIVLALFLISALLTSLFGTMKLRRDLKT